MGQFRLAIAIPSGHLWEAEFALSVVNMMVSLMQHTVPGYTQNSIKLLNKRTSLLPKSRQELIDDAMELDCTHLLFVDSDQTFPSSVVHRLAKHGKNVVGCNIATKIFPSNPTARNYNPDYWGGDVVFTKPESTGVEQVWRIGTGLMLLNLSIMKHIPKPWFQITWVPKMNDFMGEDWFFCSKLEESGVKLYIDHDLSKEVAHIGQYSYTMDDVGEVIVKEEADRLKAVG